MGCDTCIFLNNVRSLPQGKGSDEQKGEKLTPCSMKYACNPYWDGAQGVGKVVTESYCTTCSELINNCGCAQGVRNIRQRKQQFAR